MEKDLKDVAEDLKLIEIFVAGWSLGGTVAEAMTTEYPD
jgi:pimeloyl-ACP methyl ester carboxylesterase